MNQTANYQLAQWAKSDRILMDDFNADNQKIDAALASVPYVKLLDVTTQADAEQIDLDVSGIDLSEFWKLDVRVEPVAAAGCTGSIYLRCNGQTSGYRSGGSESEAGSLGYAGFADDKDLQYPGAPEFSLTLGPRLTFGRSYGAYMGYSYWSNGLLHAEDGTTIRGVTLGAAEITQLNLCASSAAKPVAAGTKIAVFGVRK